MRTVADIGNEIENWEEVKRRAANAADPSPPEGREETHYIDRIEAEITTVRDSQDPEEMRGFVQADGKPLEKTARVREGGRYHILPGTACLTVEESRPIFLAVAQVCDKRIKALKAELIALLGG